MPIAEFDAVEPMIRSPSQWPGTARSAEGKPPGPQLATDAAMHGYTVAFWVAADVFAFGAVVVGSLMRSIKVEAHAPGEPAAERTVAHA